MARLITKHANRRLYDAEQKRVITLLELSDLVAGGEDVVVELKGTGEDITAVTLLLSVLERVKRNSGDGMGSGTVERLVSAVRRAIDSLSQGGEGLDRNLEETQTGAAVSD
jgi:polyhydroxyalkanoate synthesis regulator protein